MLIKKNKAKVGYMKKRRKTKIIENWRAWEYK